MAQTIRVTESGGEATERKALMDNILKYNEEDFAVKWAVFEWLRGNGRAGQVPAARS